MPVAKPVLHSEERKEVIYEQHY